MMRKRQLFVAVGAVLVGLLCSTSVLISQPPTAPPPGAQPPGAQPPGAAPGAPAPPTGTAMLFPRLSYDEFVAEHPETAAAQIPQHYRPMRMTETQWLQLARVFRGRVEVGIPRVRGRIGRELYAPAAKQLAGIRVEMDIMKQIHDEAVERAWWFECSFPRITTSAAAPDSALITFDVIKHVRCPNFADRILARLAAFSGRGEGRTEFTVITEKGGWYRRHQLYLSAEAVGYWPGLWSGDTIEARVYDVEGGEILPGPLMRSAGHSGSTFMEMVYPPEMYYTGDASSAFPRSRLHAGGGLYEYLPEYRYYRRADGQPMRIDAREGWYYPGWSFSIPLARVAEIDRIEANLVGGAPRAGGPSGVFGGGFGDEDEEEDED